jgi:hypothetical protein
MTDMTAEEIWEAICKAAARKAGIPTEQAKTLLADAGYSADHHSGIVPACKVVAHAAKKRGRHG